jgi:hypothetical protein
MEPRARNKTGTKIPANHIDHVDKAIKSRPRRKSAIRITTNQIDHLDTASIPRPRKKSAIRIGANTIAGSHETMPSDMITRIAERAFLFYEQRGRQDGFDLEDWLRAEREMLLESIAH